MINKSPSTPFPLLKSLRVGHSPDPDDAFMFYAIAKGKISMQGFSVEHVVEDIENLNQRALLGELEVTAVSCHAYAYLADRYVVMRSGASVGDGYGPILVSRLGSCCGDSPDLNEKTIAVPGQLTTAYLVLQLYEKNIRPIFIPFDRILDAVSSGQAELGLVIHEGQITYDEIGLCKVLDLGQWWHQRHGLPLPLGIDIIRRDLGRETINSFAKLFFRSIQYALRHRGEALQYALKFGRGISSDLGDRFVGMYVNDYTVDLGARGEKGLKALFDDSFEHGLIPKTITLEFA